VNLLTSNIPTSMVIGSMSILVIPLMKLRPTPPSSVLNTTKLLLFLKYTTLLHQANYNSISELMPVMMPSMVTSTMSNSTMLMETSWVMKLPLEPS